MAGFLLSTGIIPLSALNDGSSQLCPPTILATWPRGPVGKCSSRLQFEAQEWEPPCANDRRLQRDGN